MLLFLKSFSKNDGKNWRFPKKLLLFAKLEYNIGFHENAILTTMGENRRKY
jgi:hypothetical protein